MNHRSIMEWHSSKHGTYDDFERVLTSKDTHILDRPHPQMMLLNLSSSNFMRTTLFQNCSCLFLCCKRYETELGLDILGPQNSIVWNTLIPAAMNFENICQFSDEAMVLNEVDCGKPVFWVFWRICILCKQWLRSTPLVWWLVRGLYYPIFWGLQ